MKRRLKIPLLLGYDRTGHLALASVQGDHRFLYFPLSTAVNLKVRYHSAFIIDKMGIGYDRFFSDFRRLLEGRRKRIVFPRMEGAPLELVQAEQGHFWFNINNVERISKAFHFTDNPRKMVCPPLTPEGWAVSAAISLASARALYEFMRRAWEHFLANPIRPTHNAS